MFTTATIDSIRDLLVKRGETIAVAESVTAGFLQAALASAVEAGKFFQGGLTAYNLGQKARQLDIDPICAQACNCVSESVAGSMALNGCRRFLSDWGIGITGYATPVPESGDAVFAWYAIAYRGKLVQSRRIGAGGLQREGAQLRYVDTVLSGLEGVLLDENRGNSL